jgi:hypothetical protein
MLVRDLTFIGDEQRRVQLDDDMYLVFDAVASNGISWRWDHLCEFYTDPEDGLTQKRIASYLSPGHTVLSEDPLTIQGSLLCLSCGKHGFVVEGHWIGA